MQAPHNRGHIWYLSHACGALDRGCVVQALSHPSVMAALGHVLVARVVTRADGETEKDCLQLSMLPHSVLGEMNSRDVPGKAHNIFLDYINGIDATKGCYSIETALSMASRKGTHFGRLVQVPGRVFAAPGNNRIYAETVRALAITDPWSNDRGDVMLVAQVERNPGTKDETMPAVLKDVPLDKRNRALTTTLRMAHAERVAEVGTEDYTAQARQIQETLITLASEVSPMVKPSRFGNPFTGTGRDD